MVDMIQPHECSPGCQYASFLRFESDLSEAEQENTGWQRAVGRRGRESFISNFNRESKWKAYDGKAAECWPGRVFFPSTEQNFPCKIDNCVRETPGGWNKRAVKPRGLGARPVPALGGLPAMVLGCPRAQRRVCSGKLLAHMGQGACRHPPWGAQTLSGRFGPSPAAHGTPSPQCPGHSVPLGSLTGDVTSTVLICWEIYCRWASQWCPGGLVSQSQSVVLDPSLKAQILGVK